MTMNAGGFLSNGYFRKECCFYVKVYQHVKIYGSWHLFVKPLQNYLQT